MLKEFGPERSGGQGLDPNQYESGDRAILALLADTRAKDQVDLVATWRDGAYEVWSRRGMIRFKRYADENGVLDFRIIEQIGENPLANDNHFAIATIAEELAASGQSGAATDDPNHAYFEPDVLSHPRGYERIAQLFDSPRGPDLAVSPKAYAYGIQPGQHGALDVVQSRAPLVFSGPGVRAGQMTVKASHVDIAPTIARLMGFPLIDGRGAAGNPARVYLKRQDGRVLDELLAAGGPGPHRTYLILLDGLSHSELCWQLEHNRAAIPNLALLIERGAMLSHGSIVNFPSITWPSHTTILTGAWCGHHDIVNPTFHLREQRETVPIQPNIYDGERHLSPEVETLYEAFKRVQGADAITASIHEPQGRGADHAVFERRLLGRKERLRELTAELSKSISARWARDNMPGMQREEVVDVRGLAQALHLFEHFAERPPVFVAHEFVLTDGAGHDYGPHHEGMREALYCTDRRIGQLIEMLKSRGLFDDTLFVITSDHGMAAQRIELKANPAAEPINAGLKGVTAEPFIYLRDLAVECARSRDLRGLAVTVLDNDALPDGENPPVTGARVTVAGPDGRKLGESISSESGRVAFATPSDVSDAALTVKVEHENFNSRTLRGDGSSIRPDLRTLLYSEANRTRSA